MEERELDIAPMDDPAVSGVGAGGSGCAFTLIVPFMLAVMTVFVIFVQIVEHQTV